MNNATVTVRIGSSSLLDELKDRKSGHSHPAFYASLKVGVNRLSMAEATELHNEAAYIVDCWDWDTSCPFERGRKRSWQSVCRQLASQGVPLTEVEVTA